MTRTIDDDSLDEDPLESDQDSSDESEVVACAKCGQMIAESAEICSKCGHYISLEESTPRRSHFVVMTSVAIMIALALGYVCTR